MQNPHIYLILISFFVDFLKILIYNNMVEFRKDGETRMNKLKELRKNSALTQKQISDVIGIDRSTYSYYENEKAAPSLDVLIRIAKVFNVTLDYIIFGDDSRTVQPVSVLSDNYTSYTKVDSFVNLSIEEKNLLMYSRLLDADSQKQLVEYADNLVKSKE